jgi:hypothetical protein
MPPPGRDGDPDSGRGSRRSDAGGHGFENPAAQGAQGFEKPQVKGGNGFEKLGVLGCLASENRQSADAKSMR